MSGRYINIARAIGNILSRKKVGVVGGPPPVMLNTSNLLITGQTISYGLGDDGTHQRGRLVDFVTLDHLNLFGNTNRFTDRVGTQVYADDIVIDWALWCRCRNNGRD